MARTSDSNRLHVEDDDNKLTRHYSPAGVDSGITSRSPDRHDDPSAHAELPQTPYSVFTKNQKRYIIATVSFAGFFSPVSANIYFPALNSLTKAMNVTPELINLTVTSYMIFQGLSPTFVGDFADMAGRRPAYALAFFVYIGANIGLALQNNYAALFVLRCMQSAGSSGTIALGNGVVADVADRHERGSYLGFALAGPMVGPAIGPVLGGILSEYLGWRSIFWFLTIAAGLFLVTFLITFPETGRNVVGNGSVKPQAWNVSLLSYLRPRNRLAESVEPAKKTKLRFPNPMHSLHLLTEKDVANVLFYHSIPFTAYYCVAASFPALLKQIYGFNDLQIGLCYLPFGGASMLASISVGIALDKNFKRLKEEKSRSKEDDFPIEAARLQVVAPLVAVGVCAIIAHGWALYAKSHLAVPLVTSFIIGFTITGVVNCCSTLLVDLYPMSPSTATAAFNFVRCLLGATGTALVDRMIHGMGVGWCFTFWGLICVAASPMLLVAVRYGPEWRRTRMARAQKEKESKENEKGDPENGGNKGVTNQ